MKVHKKFSRKALAQQRDGGSLRLSTIVPGENRAKDPSQCPYFHDSPNKGRITLKLTVIH